MIKIIFHKQLNLFLSKSGPCIYYHNANIPGINEYIVRQMHIWSNKYPALNIFEVSYDKKVEKTLNVRVENINKLFLYYRGEKKLVINEPKQTDFKEIFHKFIFFYNEKLERLAENYGSRKFLKIQEEPNSNKTKEKTKTDKANYIKNMVSKYLRKKIIISDEQDLLKRKEDLEKLAKNLEKKGFHKIAPKSDSTIKSKNDVDKIVQNVNSILKRQANILSELEHNKIIKIFPSSNMINFYFITKPLIFQSAISYNPILNKIPINPLKNSKYSLKSLKTYKKTHHINHSLTDNISNCNIINIIKDNKTNITTETNILTNYNPLVEQKSKWFDDVTISDLPTHILD